MGQRGRCWKPWVRAWRLDGFDALDYAVERSGHHLVHRFGFVPLDEKRFIAIAPEQILELIVWDTGQHGWTGDLGAVQM